MRRRDFVGLSIAAITGLAVPSVAAPVRRPAVRAAIVIGVDKAGDFPALNAAASGARQVADWLRSEGFEAKLFMDDQKPVESRELKAAIKELVNRGTLDQLVIYFSGHGFLNSYTEYWLLSGAPNDVDEAICLQESVELARRSAIRSVVFVSDACRSTPTSLGTSRVRGSVVFPNSSASSDVHTDIDQFLATLPGDPAFEVSVSESAPEFQGIYTASFLSAFKNPTSAMVRTVDGMSFVHNRSLRLYLEVDVRKRAESKSIRLRQRPDARVESDYDTYIGRVITVSSGPAPPSPATLNDVAHLELNRAGANLSDSARVMSVSELSDVATRTGFDKAQQLILRTQEPRPPEMFVRQLQTGLTVTGVVILGAAANPRIRVEILDAGDGDRRPAFVRADLGGESAGSVALHFANGNGTVLAVLREFIASVTVDDGKVTNVSYIPSRSSSRWQEYERESDRLDRLRAAVATSARFGQFRIEGEPQTRNQMAEQLADQIRILKGLDPTLGIYAAYAYAEAGLMDKVRSVRDFMRGDLQTDLFDVVMLSGSTSEMRPLITEQLLPFCPMLSQGWNLLRVKGVRLSPKIAEARDHLLGALWTTFDEAGMRIVRNALQAGAVQ
jgi:caspase domain-containing protein